MNAPVPFLEAVKRPDRNEVRKTLRELQTRIDMQHVEHGLREQAIREKAYFLWLDGHSEDPDANWRAAEAMLNQK